MGLVINYSYQISLTEMIHMQFIHFPELNGSGIKGVWNVNTNKVWFSDDIWWMVDTGSSDMNRRKSALDQCVKIDTDIRLIDLKQLKLLN